jgi:hypothetical protein
MAKVFRELPQSLQANGITVVVYIQKNCGKVCYYFKFDVLDLKVSRTKHPRPLWIYFIFSIKILAYLQGLMQDSLYYYLYLF